MKLSELNHDQRVELKQTVPTETMDARGESPSYCELADADELVTDEELERRHGGTEFTEDDFANGGEAA